jgi:hypothetical protein
MAAARPDPFCLTEDHWLTHLEAAHPEVFVGLAQHLPPELGPLPRRADPPAGRRPLRAAAARGDPQRDHDVRLAFPNGVSTPEELREQLNGLVMCRYRRAGVVHRERTPEP